MFHLRCNTTLVNHGREGVTLLYSELPKLYSSQCNRVILSLALYGRVILNLFFLFFDKNTLWVIIKCASFVRECYLMFYCDMAHNVFRDFPRPILGPNIAPSHSKNEQKLPKLVNNSTNSLALQFGENFMKISTKIAKLQMFSFTHWCKHL